MRARRSASLIRDCHPGPVALNFAITSRSNRSETGCLFEPRGRPPPLNLTSSSAGSDSGPLERANISSVHSGLSESGLEVISISFFAIGATNADGSHHGPAKRYRRAIRFAFD